MNNAAKWTVLCYLIWRNKKLSSPDSTFQMRTVPVLVDMKISLRMPFLVGQAVVVLVDVLFRLALDNQPNAWEDEEGGKSLRAFEDSQAYEHADRNRDQGLHIIVYRNHCGSECLLTDHHQDVAQISAEEDDVARFPPCRYWHLSPWDGGHMRGGEWQDHDRCPGEHPLVDGEERILSHQGLEERQIERKRQLCSHAE